jgi:hypothetical protein
MRKLPAPCLAATLLAGCANVDRWPAFVGPGATLTGRVVASRLVVPMTGDVAGEAYAYVVEPSEAPGSRVMVLPVSEDCAAARTDGRSYRMRLSRQWIMYGLTANPEDRSWTPSLAISDCVAVGG